jgi:hypothetical protein
MATVAQPPEAPHNLKKDCLSYSGVIAQSISVIAPSTVPDRDGPWKARSRRRARYRALVSAARCSESGAPGRAISRRPPCPAKRYEADIPNAAAEILT